MNESVAYRQPVGVTSRHRTRTVFAQTTGYVAATAALFAIGAYLRRHLADGVGIVAFIAAFGCLICMRFAACRSL